MGQTRQQYHVPANNVIDWQGNNPVYAECRAGSSDIAPGMLVYLSDSIDNVCLASGSSGDYGYGYALYVETASYYQKADVTSTYDKDAWIAVAKLTGDFVIHCPGTAAQLNAEVYPDGATTLGAVVDVADGSAQAVPNVGRALSTTISGKIYVKVGA